VYDRINAPMGKRFSVFFTYFSHACPKDTLIAQMEANSGIKFGQAQVALARQWVGDSADPSMPTQVAVKLPEPTTEGIVLSNKTEVKLETYPLPRLYSDAVAVIEQFERGANALVGRQHDAVADTVGQHALQDQTELGDEQWLGSEEEELNSYVFF
jgi:phospholipase D1/2